MRFLWTQSLESTQVLLADYVRNQYTMNMPFVIATREQTKGIGSRANTWDKITCGLYLSCALPITLLPSDLPKQSTSIYFGQILLELLQEFHDGLWLKWPNDFYLQDYKVGGLITQYIREYMVFGIGLNIFSEQQHSLLTNGIPAILQQKEIHKQQDSLESISLWILSAIIKKILHFLSFNIVEFDLQKDMDITTHDFVCKTFLQDTMAWGKILERYKKDFSKNHRFYTHIQEDGYTREISLQHAQLQDDGSIVLHDKILYSLR